MKATLPRPQVLTPFPNGKRTPVQHIIDAIVDSLECFGGDERNVVILVDREKRTETAKNISTSLFSVLSPKFPSMKFHIGVSDRHIENWIVADEELMCEIYKLNNHTYCGDGNFGDPQLYELCTNKSIGHVDRAKLLKSARASRIATQSASFKSFHDTIDFDWYWAAR